MARRRRGANGRQRWAKLLIFVLPTLSVLISVRGPIVVRRTKCVVPRRSCSSICIHSRQSTEIGSR
jgi:hypothetical protein